MWKENHYTGCPIILALLCFFAILLASTLPKYKSWGSIKKIQEICYKIGTKNLKIDLELAEITDVKVATYNTQIIFLRLSNSKMSISK